MITKENALEWIPLLQALAEGELQFQDRLGKWRDDVQICSSDCLSKYRLRPKPIEGWATYYPKDKISTGSICGGVYESEEIAQKNVGASGQVIHMRQVIE